MSYDEVPGITYETPLQRQAQALANRPALMVQKYPVKDVGDSKTAAKRTSTAQASRSSKRLRQDVGQPATSLMEGYLPEHKCTSVPPCPPCSVFLSLF